MTTVRSGLLGSEFGLRGAVIDAIKVAIDSLPSLSCADDIKNKDFKRLVQSAFVNFKSAEDVLPS